VPPRCARHLIAVGALLIPIGLAACGSSSSDSSASDAAASSGPAASTSGATTPESEAESGETYVEVSDREVTAGLVDLGKRGAVVVATIAAGKDATSDVDEMFEKWQSIEGTIKEKESDLYLDFEDSLANLHAAAKDKDAAAATGAVAAFARTSGQYLVKHP
jgi:hypothetical protein